MEQQQKLQELLRQRLEEVRRIYSHAALAFPDWHIENLTRWQSQVEVILRNYFGPESPQLKQFKEATCAGPTIEISPDPFVVKAQAVLEAILFELEISKELQPAASRFSNRTLSCAIDILADGCIDSELRNFFFKHNLLDIYTQSGRLTAKRRKVNDVFQHLCAADDDSAARTLESIVREALKMLYPWAESSQCRREYFFRKFPDLDAALRADGYQVREGELVPVLSPLVEAVKEEGIVERLLGKRGFDIAKNHLTQSYENYVEGNWEAANGALRSFLQDVFDQIALIIAPQEARRKEPGGERRKLLQEKGFIESDAEAKLVSTFFQFASHKGSHPGISNESDSRLRRYIAIALASYYLEKLEVVCVEAM